MHKYIYKAEDGNFQTEIKKKNSEENKPDALNLIVNAIKYIYIRGSMYAHTQAHSVNVFRMETVKWIQCEGMNVAGTYTATEHKIFWHGGKRWQTVKRIGYLLG